MGSQGLPWHVIPSGRRLLQVQLGKAGFRAPTGLRLIRGRIPHGVRYRQGNQYLWQDCQD